MKRKPRVRFFVLSILMLGMMAALVIQLFQVTVVEGEAYATQATAKRQKTIYSTSARGRILDRNGIPLAYDETSYNVQFSRDPDRRDSSSSALYTEALLTAIEIIEAGGGTLIDTSYIRMNEVGELYYDWGVTSPSAIKARYKNFCNANNFYIEDDMSTWPTAEKAYKMLRASWKIPEELPFEEAVKVISVRQEINLNQWRAYEPVTIAYNVSMDVVAQLDMLSDELLGISTIQSTVRVYPWGSTASHIVGYLSRQVSDSISETSLQGMGYSAEDYAYIENIYVTDDDGVLVFNENGSKQVQMTRMGYSYSDYIGVAGVERTMEKYLTASTTERRGTQVVEINNSLVVTRELERTGASPGNDVMLTIDLPLQQATEQALAHAIQTVSEYEKSLIEEDKNGKYSKLREDTSTIKTAAAGSIVVLDIHTGKTLAMASSPSYDPNEFIAGISSARAVELFENPESNNPTLNRAIASPLAPGSIFKMATGLAGLMEGVITPTSTMSDGKVQEIGSNGIIRSTSESTPKGRYTNFMSGDTIGWEGAPKCWTDYPHNHADLDLKAALGQSCNYYFFSVADAIGIEKLNNWSTRLGLNSKTGIELPGELSSRVGGQKVLYDNSLPLSEQKSSLPGYVFRSLQLYLKEILNRSGRQASDEAIKACALKILELQDGSGKQPGEDIRQILSDELGLPITLTLSQSQWVLNISSMLNELQWKAAMSIRAGIGQGTTLITPVAVARYAAAFGNGGTVYDVHIVDRVLDEHGSVVKAFEPTVHDYIEAPQEYWNTIRAGLESVLSHEDLGTAAGKFSDDFAQTYLPSIIGKTGSAQVSLTDKVDIENTSWFVTLLPKDDPEIVVVTCIPYGLSGTTGGPPAVEQIVRFYLDRKEGAAKDNLVSIDGIVP